MTLTARHPRLLRSILAFFTMPFAIWGEGRTACANIIMFSDPQSFFQAAKVVSTETFDELPSDVLVGVGSVALGGITYTSADPSAGWVTSDSFVNPSPPNSFGQGNVIAPATLKFGQSGRTDAVGFCLLTIPGGDYRFQLATADRPHCTASALRPAPSRAMT